MQNAQNRISQENLSKYLNGSYSYYGMNKTMNLNGVKLGKVLWKK